MEQFDLTILTIEQVAEENGLNIFKKYGYKSEVTDFSILLGAYVYRTLENHLYGDWWLQGIEKEYYNIAFTTYGTLKTSSPDKRDIGIRPVINFSQLNSNFRKNVNTFLYLVNPPKPLHLLKLANNSNNYFVVVF